MPASSSVIATSVMLIIASVLMVIGSIASIFVCRYHCYRKNDDGLKMLELIVIIAMLEVNSLAESVYLYNYCTCRYHLVYGS